MGERSLPTDGSISEPEPPPGGSYEPPGGADDSADDGARDSADDQQQSHDPYQPL